MGLVPLSEVSLRALSLASRFLVVLATALHLGVLQAFYGVVTFVGSAACISLCSSVWGPVGVAHPFHPSLFLGGVLV